jgi:anti-sigma factor RsiW
MGGNKMTQSLSNEEQALAAGYVLGDLTPEEELQVMQLLSTNPAMEKEVEALRVSLQLVPHGCRDSHASRPFRRPNHGRLRGQ